MCPHEHPDVTLDCMALERSMAAWVNGEPGASALPTLNSTRLLARAAFDVAVGHRALPTWRGAPKLRLINRKPPRLPRHLP